MKRYTFFIFILAILSLISGYLISKVSWFARVGMSLFYQQYDFLKDWKLASLAVFSTLMVLFIIHAILEKILSKNVSVIVNIITFLAAIVGLYTTYHDFRHDLTHRWTGERFHIGFYLFWLSWMLISIFFILHKKQVKLKDLNNMGAANQ